MKSRKNTMKHGGGTDGQVGALQTMDPKLAALFGEYYFDILGGSKRKSRKSRKAKKTKKGRGVHEGGKKKCPKHCRRHTRHTRKGLKHRKN